MRLNERWIWVGDTLSPNVAGIIIYADFPGQWWLVRGSEMAGPFDDSQILRALRIACTPVIDGCEKGPAKSGFLELENRRVLKPRPKRYERAHDELPPSTTVYDEEGLKPISGCCTRFDSMPSVVWGPLDGSEPPPSGESLHAGTLASSWNTHPKGSLVYCGDKMTFAGLTVVDRP